MKKEMIPEVRCWFGRLLSVWNLDAVVDEYYIRNEYRCSNCTSVFISEIEFKKHRLTHSSSSEIKNSAKSMNGCIEIDTSNDSDDANLPINKKEVNDATDNKLALKKEELSEEKFIVDDILLNDNNDMNIFPNDSNDDFSFTFNPDEDLPNNFLEDESGENPLGECESDGVDYNHDQENEGADDAGDNEGSVGENSDSNDMMDNTAAEDAETDNMNSEDGDDGEDGDVGDTEADQEEDENEPDKDGEHVYEHLPEPSEHTVDNISETPDENMNADEDSLPAFTPQRDHNVCGQFVEQMDAAQEPKIAEESEKENDKEVELENMENKRPSSRESTASTTSSSSERTLTIRSAFEVNKMITSSSDVTVKSENSSEKVEKPGLSILNPTQLGAPDTMTGGENLLSKSYVPPPADSIYIAPGLSNGCPSYQCDVCETQFSDTMVLEEHRLNAGHYKCHYSPECTSFVFQNVTELVNHQQTAHGVINQSPVQQLQHQEPDKGQTNNFVGDTVNVSQVQNIPMRYQLDQPVGNNYQTMPSFQQTSGQQTRSVVPSGYPSTQSNVQMRQYNLQTTPRIHSVRGSVPMPNSGNALKRPPSAPQPSRMTPPKRRCPDNVMNRNGDADCKVVSIQKPDNTDDVVAQLSKSITITTRQEIPKKNDTTAVANMLANRGITVSSVPSKQNRNSNAVTMLNLNSAVSLIPTNKSNGNRQNSGFAVPQGRVSTGRPGGGTTASGRMTTVDLTGPDPPRNKPLNRMSRFTCQICDRTFFSQDQLNQHMITHKSVSRKQLPYKCNLCTAQYPNQQSLIQHRQQCHRDSVSSTNEMVIPIVDLKQPGALHKLQSVGINYMIPLNALGSQSSNGSFGIPILPFSSDRTTITNMTSCGISNILPVGPLKALGR